MKKAASLLLAVVMIFSMNFAAFAETVDTETAAPETIAEGIAETILDELETENETASVQASANSGRITADPADVSVYACEDAVFSVETSGSVAKYQWQISQTNGLFWTNLSARSYGASETITVNARKAYNNALFRCVVTFKDRKTAVSNAARLTVLASGIAADPADAVVAVGSEAVFTVGTNGPVNYVQWQVLKAGAKKWANLDQAVYGNAGTLTFTAAAEDDGLQVRAYVVFKDGTKVTSKAAVLTVNEAVEAVSETVELENVSVAVDYSSDVFDEAVELSAEVFDEDSKGYKEAEAVMAANDVSYEGMMAVDISFLSKANGNEVEPSGDVNVNLQADLASLGEDVDPESIRVWHITENGLEQVSGAVYEAPVEEPEPEPEIEEPVELSAAFTVNSFSTFTVTWGNNEGNSVTVHHGYMENGAFVEFTASQSLNPNNYPNTRLRARDYSSGQYAYLIYDFKEYKYSATYRTTGEIANPTTGTAVRPTLRANGGTNNANNRVWQTQTTDGTYNNLANGNHVYVIYTPKTATTGYTPSTDEDPDTPHPETYVPEVGKVVTDMKPDGTYDITLSVVGHEESSEKVVKARVIVVFDVSGSMMNDIAGTGVYLYNGHYYKNRRQTYGRYEYYNMIADEDTRLQKAKNAVNAMADVLLEKEDSQGNKLVELGLISFSSDASKHTLGGLEFTSSYSTYSSAINALTADGGTNWEASLDLANSMAASTYGKTYVVFVSDGDPTFRTSRDDVSDAEIAGNGDDYDYNDGTIRFGTGSGSYDQCYNTALIAAKSIVSHNKTLYTVGLSGDSTRMTNLASEAGGIYYDGSDEESFANALSSIASAISSELGLTDVQITDGVTEMSQVATDALIGTAGNFIYRKGTNADISQNPIWNGAPEAELNANNSVVWDLSDAGKLDNGVTYSVTFTVWPKQEAYDLIADLQNGLTNKELTQVTDLTDGVKVQLRVLVNGTTYEYASGKWNGTLTDADLEALLEANAATAIFSMKTNTGLTATYEYGGVPGEHSYTNYINGNMTLDSETFGIRKLWSNLLPQDSRTAQMLTDEDGYLINKDGTQILSGGQPVRYDADIAKDLAVYYIDLIVTKSGEEYEEVRLYSVDNWELDDIYISLGVLSINGSAITVREIGHEYTVIEKPSDAYYWELDAETYRPMFINGQTVMLLKVEESDADYDAVKDMADKTTRTVNDTTYYKFGDSAESSYIYKAISAEGAVMEATNKRRSYLNITKNVEEEDAPADALFTYKVKITIPDAKQPTDPDFNVNTDPVWFSVFDGTQAVKDLVVSDNVTAETVGGENTGYFWVASGAEFTFRIKAGWNFRATNLLSGTTYEITELTDIPTNMDAGFKFKDVEASASTQIVEDGTYVPVPVEDYDFTSEEDASVTGSIEAPNTSYTVTYTNEWLGAFYVYHSSNNTIEKIFLTDSRVVNGKFNILNEVRVDDSADKDTAAPAGTKYLYGGYFKAYGGQKLTSDEIIASTGFTEDANKKLWLTDTGADAYSYAYIKSSSKGAWTETGDTGAYTEDGKAVTVAKDTVYYLKEVPTGYLRPYIHYTYFVEDHRIGDIWTMSAVDDANYNGTGFVIGSTKTSGSVANSITIKAANNSASSVKLTAANVFANRGVQDGYIVYKKDTANLKKSGTTILYYWETLDGNIVYGTQQRTVTIVSTGGVMTDITVADSYAYTIPE